MRLAWQAAVAESGAHAPGAGGLAVRAGVDQAWWTQAQGGDHQLPLLHRPRSLRACAIFGVLLLLPGQEPPDRT